MKVARKILEAFVPSIEGGSLKESEQRVKTYPEEPQEK